MGLFTRKKDVQADANFTTKGRSRRIGLTFGILAVTVGISYTWYKKDPQTGEKPKAKKEFVITKESVDSETGSMADTLFYIDSEK